MGKIDQPRSIFKNTVAQTVSDLLTRGSNILILYVMARTLHATGVGIYATALAYFALIDEATNMGATTFLIREIAKEPSQTSRYVVNFTLLGSLVALVGMLIFWAALPHLGYSAELMLCMAIIVLAAAPGTFNAVQYSVFVAHQRVEFVTYTTLVSSLLTIGANLYLLLSGYGVFSLIVVFVVIQYLVALIYFYFINRYITVLRWTFEPAFTLQLVREIKTFAALSLLGGVLAQPEVIILSLVASEAQVGFYSSALKLSQLWLFISQIYMNNVYPVLSRTHHLEEKFQFVQDKSIKYLLAVSLPLAVGITATAEPIVNLIYGPGFEAAVLPLRILAWNIPISFVGAVLWRALVARNRQNAVLGVRLVTLFTRLAGGYVLAAPLACVGASISTVLNLLLNALLLAAYLKRDGGRLSLVSLAWRFGLAALGMGLLAWGLGHYVQLWVLVPVAAIAYAGLVFGLRAFAPDDWALFRRIWRPHPVGEGQ